jgi:hypothetical protein
MSKENKYLNKKKMEEASKASRQGESTSNAWKNLKKNLGFSKDVEMPSKSKKK